MFTSLQEEHQTFFEDLQTNLTSFQRDYKNPSLFYELIQIGTRIEDKARLVERCWEEVGKCTEANEYTPDKGGYLCVIGYNATDRDLGQDYVNLVWDYILECDKNNPHNLRWCISLSYLLGKITGDTDWYHRCIQFDWRGFNPLILTKVLLACMEIARDEMNQDHEDNALEILDWGLEQFKEGLATDQDKTIGGKTEFGYQWMYFGCAELAELCDIAGQLCRFIRHIELYHSDTKAFEEAVNWIRFGRK